MRLIVLLLMLLFPAAAPAQAPTAASAAAPAFQARTGELVAILEGGGDYDAFFAPAFRQAVPRATFLPLAEQLSTALGKPTGVERTVATSPWDAELTVGTAPRGGDSADRLTADFAALPGRGGFGVYALGGGAPRLIVGANVDRAAPLGSAFKLWVLAEAARQVATERRRWRDVLAVGQPSLPSGIVQGWPRGAPVTLHTLATLMISISDNSATDTLMTALGRGKVDVMAVAAGGTAPVLTTREFFALKSDPALARRWIAADAAGKVGLLADSASVPLDVGIFASGKPIMTDTVEWFASPARMAALLDRLRRDRDDTARAILAVNPGTDPTTAARFAYVGFKGGSEPGVITLNYLVRDRAGRWFAVVGNWHRTDADVVALQFTSLMGRALALAR